MELITVAPLSRGRLPGELSYFSRKAVAPGSVVEVPVRSKRLPGIVISSEPVKQARLKIRQASFALKQAEALTPRPMFLSELLTAARETARASVAPVGHVLASIIPSEITKRPERMPTLKSRKQKKVMVRAPEPQLIQGGFAERASRYRSLARETLARGASLFLFAPSIHEAEALAAAVGEGIEEKTFLVHGGLKPAEGAKRYRSCALAKRPVVLVGTPIALSLPRQDIGAIALDRESARGWRTQDLRSIDLSALARRYAAALSVPLYLGDRALSISTLHACERDEAVRDAVFSNRASGAPLRVIDRRKKADEPFSVLWPELVEAIKAATSSGGNVFLFGARRGLSPTTLCADCGTAVLCDGCGGPVVLHAKKPRNLFVCHRCGASRPAHETCRSCGGWNLKALGIGSQRIAEAITKVLPEARVHVLDGDSAPDESKARVIVDAFLNDRGGILIGTERALPYLPERLALTAVVSLDSLLILPDLASTERLFSLLLFLKEKTEGLVLVGTRSPETPLLRAAEAGDIAAFYEHERREREKNGLPPFGTLISIAVTGTRPSVESGVERLLKLLARWSPLPLPLVERLPKGAVVRFVLLILPKDAQANEPELLALLGSLPPSMVASVNPGEFFGGFKASQRKK